MIKRKKDLQISDRSIKNLKEYITEKSKEMSREEVLWIFRKEHSRRTDEEIESLVNCNLPMVYTIAVRLLKNHQTKSQDTFPIPFADIYNAGVIGLYTAIEKFDSFRNTKFSTYAYPWIESRMRILINEHIYPMRKQPYATLSFEYLDDPDVTHKQRSCTKEYDSIMYNDLLAEIEKMATSREWIIFSAYYLEEKTQKEVANIMACSVASVRYHIKKIKVKINLLRNEKTV